MLVLFRVVLHENEHSSVTSTENPRNVPTAGEVIRALSDDQSDVKELSTLVHAIHSSELLSILQLDQESTRDGSCGDGAREDWGVVSGHSESLVVDLEDVLPCGVLVVDLDAVPCSNECVRAGRGTAGLLTDFLGGTMSRGGAFAGP
jgi:hypothetical protein